MRDADTRIALLEGRVDAHFKMLVDLTTAMELKKLRATIEEERSKPCSHSSLPSASATSSSSADSLALGILASLGMADGLWLSREEILALLGEPS